MAVSKKIHNYNYAPGIATYGIQGEVGDAGENGNTIFFTNFNLASSATTSGFSGFATKLYENKTPILNSTEVLSREYLNGDCFFAQDGTIYRLKDIDSLKEDIGNIKSYNVYMDICGSVQIDKGNYVYIDDKELTTGRLEMNLGYKGFDILADSNLHDFINTNTTMNIISNETDSNNNINLMQFTTANNNGINSGILKLYYDTNDNAFHISSNNQAILLNNDVKVSNTELSKDIDNYSNVITSNNTITMFKTICDYSSYNIVDSTITELDLNNEPYTYDTSILKLYIDMSNDVYNFKNKYESIKNSIFIKVYYENNVYMYSLKDALDTEKVSDDLYTYSIQCNITDESPLYVSLMYNTEFTIKCSTDKDDTDGEYIYRCFNITAIDDCTVSLNNYGSNTPILYYYTYDTLAWIRWDYDTLSIPTGTSIYMYGINSYGVCKSDTIYSTFNIEGRASLAGNIQSLINKTCPTTISNNYSFYKLFENCNTIISTPKLSALILSDYCYAYMFSGCSNLKTTTNLPAYILTKGCYSHMFENCTSLELQITMDANTLNEECFSYMYSGCISLTEAADLNILVLAKGCYSYMFANCTSLLNAPLINAATLAQDCCNHMFYNCTNIIAAQDELSPLNLEISCYESMFEGCERLLIAPVLPATDLIVGCYKRMFYGGLKLKFAKILAEKTLSDDLMSEIFDDTNEEYGTLTMYESTYNYGTNKDYVTSILPEHWNVNLIKETENYLCFSTTSNEGTVKLNQNGSINPILYYSYNKENWIKWDYSELAISDSSLLYMYGENPNGINRDDEDYNYFELSGYVKLSGNIMSLISIDYNNATIKNKYCFAELFNNNDSLITISELILPTETLTEGCYEYMFESCKSLIDTPIIKATTLAKYCYFGMFEYCESLKTYPTLNATNLATSCYANMFSGCTSLTGMPTLPATTLADSCYTNMFKGCTSLKTIKKLPATTLADNCYSYMFYGCTSLTTAPKLSATTLTSECYSYMFYGCTSLTTTPELPATTLTEKCYYGMFLNCTSIKTPSAISAKELYKDCCNAMFKGCTSLTTTPALVANELKYNSYYEMFSGCTSLTTTNTITIGKTDNHSCYMMFKDCTKLTSASKISILSNGEAYCCASMFDGCTSLLNTPKMNIYNPLSQCCSRMFKGCSSLSTANNIILNEGNTQSYEYMFDGCTSMQYGPSAIKISEAGNKCCSYMFNGCTLLKEQTLDIIDVAAQSYEYMFLNCTSLKQLNSYSNNNYAIELNVGVDDVACCSYMFKGCTSLVSASNIKLYEATKYSYNHMFSECTSLSGHPTLKISNTNNDIIQCCSYMFNKCTSLTTLNPIYMQLKGCGNHSYENMFAGDTSLEGTSFILQCNVLQLQCYINMFNGCKSLSYVYIPATDISATDCLSNWLKDVSTSEDCSFYKNASTNFPINSASGIPTGWTIHNIIYVTIDDKKVVVDPEVSYKNNGHTTLYTSKYRNVANDATKYKVDTDTTHPKLGDILYTSIEVGCLSFLAYNEDSTIKIKKSSSFLTNTPKLYYSFDKSTWKTIDFSTTISISSGDTVYISGNNTYINTSANYTYFLMSGNIKASGNIQTLLSGDLNKDITTPFCFYSLFISCTSLISAPDLTATTLTNGCYYNLFYGCTNLNQVKCYATDISASNCLTGWMNSVSSIGTFYKDSNTTYPEGESGIPTGWTIVNIDE